MNNLRMAQSRRIRVFTALILVTHLIAGPMVSAGYSVTQTPGFAASLEATDVPSVSGAPVGVMTLDSSQAQSGPDMGIEPLAAAATLDYSGLVLKACDYYDAPSITATKMGSFTAMAVIWFSPVITDATWIVSRDTSGNDVYLQKNSIEQLPDKTATDTKVYTALLLMSRNAFSAPSTNAPQLEKLPYLGMVTYQKWTEDGKWVYGTNSKGQRIFYGGAMVEILPDKTATDTKVYTALLLMSRKVFSAPSTNAKELGTFAGLEMVSYQKWTEDGKWVYGTNSKGQRIFYGGAMVEILPDKTATDTTTYYAQALKSRYMLSAPSTQARIVGKLDCGAIIAYQKWTADGSWVFTTNEKGQRLFFGGASLQAYTGPIPGVFFGTYIDVDLTKQKVHYVVNGTVKLATDVVTGKPSTPTPSGTFSILYKQSPAVLVGADYAAPVSFWMPFTSVGHGFHDANWQPWFGGDRWTYAGSHGCVNMPYWAAAELYRLAPAGSRVSIHW